MYGVVSFTCEPDSATLLAPFFLIHVFVSSSPAFRHLVDFGESYVSTLNGSGVRGTIIIRGDEQTMTIRREWVRTFRRRLHGPRSSKGQMQNNLLEQL